MTSKEPFDITVNVPDKEWNTEAGSATLCGAKSQRLLRYQFAGIFLVTGHMVEPVCQECSAKYQLIQDNK